MPGVTSRWHSTQSEETCFEVSPPHETKARTANGRKKRMRCSRRRESKSSRTQSPDTRFPSVNYITHYLAFGPPGTVRFEPTRPPHKGCPYVAPVRPEHGNGIDFVAILVQSCYPCSPELLRNAQECQEGGLSCPPMQERRLSGVLFRTNRDKWPGSAGCGRGGRKTPAPGPPLFLPGSRRPMAGGRAPKKMG